MKKAQSIRDRPKGKRLTLCGSVKISRRQLILNWALKDVYDLNKDKDIPGLEVQEFQQKHRDTEKIQAIPGKSKIKIVIFEVECGS